MKRIFGNILAAAMLVIMGACSGAKLSVADEQMARGEYFDASKTYRKVYNKLTKREQRPERGLVAYRMAECYRHLNMSARASAAYQNAIRYGYPDSTAQLHLARMLHAEGKYAPAIKAYEEYLAIDPDNALALTGVEGARKAQQLKSKRTRYVVKQSRLLN